MGLPGCSNGRPNERLDDGLPPASARLLARPGAQASRLAAGLHPLGLGPGRDGLLYVPAASQAGSVPLLVMLHGAGSSAGRMWESIRRDVGEGVAVLLPESRGWTWDFVHGDFGPDLRFIDAALERTFAMVPVDSRRIALAGFSAGGAMALSLGPSNGDLFSWVFAFAPTFMDAAGRVGRPRFFVAHGTADTIVPIDRSSRAIVPALRAGGYFVVYREMAGWPHAVAPESVHEALSFLVEGS
jgi:phospholipase/carboxylesterase